MANDESNIEAAFEDVARLDLSNGKGEAFADPITGNEDTDACLGNGNKDAAEKDEGKGNSNWLVAARCTQSFFVRLYHLIYDRNSCCLLYII